MHCVDALQRDMNRLIHRRAGRRQNAHYCEWLVVVQTKTGRSQPVSKYYFAVHAVAQGLCYFGPQHCVKGAFKRRAIDKFNTSLLAVAKMIKVRAGRTHHPIPLVRVTEGNGDRPRNSWISHHLLIGFPTNIVGGRADPEHRIEQQIQGSGLCAHNEVDTRHRTGKTISSLLPDMLYP